MQDIITVIKDLGFPMAVAAWALWQSKNHEEYLQGVLSQSLEKMTEALEELKEVLIHDKTRDEKKAG